MIKMNEVVGRVRWQIARVVRTPKGDDRDKYERNLKSSLNTALTGLSMIRLSIPSDHADNAFINGIMDNLDRYHEMMENGENDKAIDEMKKIFGCK